jgi:two-component system chemotaxis response regulator CheY
MVNTTSKKILIADDDHTVTLALRTVLELEGYLVETASDGHEVVRVLQTFWPHALILDVMMPKENGDQLSRKIKMRLGDVEIKPPKILLITGKYLDQDPSQEERMIRSSLADAIFYKPFSAKDLVPVVQSLIG